MGMGFIDCDSFSRIKIWLWTKLTFPFSLSRICVSVNIDLLHFLYFPFLLYYGVYRTRTVISEKISVIVNSVILDISTDFQSQSNQWFYQIKHVHPLNKNGADFTSWNKVELGYLNSII